MRNRRWLPLIWLAVAALLSLLSWWQTRQSVAASLVEQLRAQLPARLSAALHSRRMDANISEWVRQQLAEDLAALTPQGVLPTLQSCHVTVGSLTEDGPQPAGDLLIEWQLGEQIQRARFALECNTKWPVLLGSQSALALLLVSLLAMLPRPLSPGERRVHTELRQRGLSLREARALSPRLAQLNPVQRSLFTELLASWQQPASTLMDWLEEPSVASLAPERLAWFRRGMELSGDDPETSLNWARAADALHFDREHYRVLVHGVPVTLSKTPFFYFLWYAQRRVQGEGWYLNPPVNRPDHEAAAALVALMENGGHNKAINDLKGAGLRAKTLDQNRNKIREEMISVLGESLAADYLFEADRDQKTGRYRYRLLLPSDRIHFL